jgi:hypothetical protein
LIPDADGSTVVVKNAAEKQTTNPDSTVTVIGEITVEADRRLYGAVFYCTGEIKTEALEYHNVVNANVTVHRECCS